MSFASPLALLCLFAVPLAVLAHVAAQRRRRRYPVRFTALSTLAAVAGREPQWRRHLPLALFALALAALALSLARPERTIQVAVQRASVVLVTDVSRSMSATDVQPDPPGGRAPGGAELPRQGSQRAARRPRHVLRRRPDAADADHRPRRGHERARHAAAGLRHGDGRRAAHGAGRPEGAPLDGAAPAGGARPAVRRIGDRRRRRGHRRRRGPAPARADLHRRARHAGRHDHAARPDAERPARPRGAERIASESGGQAFRAEDSDQLDAVYEKLGSQIGTEPEKQEITALFAGGALLLLAGAMLTSLRLGGRLP